MEISERIIQLMRYYGLSQSDFADKLSIQSSTISHLTSGRNKPSIEMLIKIKSTFPKISLDWLIMGVGSIENNLDEIPREKPVISPTPLDVKKELETIVFFYKDGSFKKFE